MQKILANEECLRLNRDRINMAEQLDAANKNLKKVISFCAEMLELADLGDNYRFDDGCGVVFGTLRDSAYKIRKLAEEELERHNKKG